MALTNRLVRTLASHASTLHVPLHQALCRHRTFKQEQFLQSARPYSQNQRYFALKTQVQLSEGVTNIPHPYDAWPPANH